MSSTIVSLSVPERPWIPRSTPLTIGKDVLELLTTSMYVDPMTLYREYIQNAADGIDEARALGILRPHPAGVVEISIDAPTRTVRIRDNGIGVPGVDFERRLTAFGASSKRGTDARGFRGVGRLVGIGYCQELVLRSRYAGESDVNEMRWDCRKVKAALRTDDRLTLEEVVNGCVQVRSVGGRSFPEHFFEVELRGVIRHRNDNLLNQNAIYDYLSQVAPVPFSPDFKLRDQIMELLGNVMTLGELTIKITGIEGPVYRPHRDRLSAPQFKEEFVFTDVEPVNVPSADGGQAGIGWILHHEYKGALPFPQLRGLRLRAGNIQVGGNDLMQQFFPETRFNSWAVGEIHTIDRRIVPNGRRDHFEQNVHFDNLVNHISVVARNIGSRCRTSSSQRNWTRKFEHHRDRVKSRITALQQGAVGRSGMRLLEAEIGCDIAEMHKIAAKESLPPQLRSELSHQVNALTKRVSRFTRVPKVSKSLQRLSSVKKHVYEHVFSLIYRHLGDQAQAHRLVEAMLLDIAKC